MTAQEIIEKIRAEIERLKKDRRTPHTGKYYEGYLSAFKKMSQALDTLQEQPVDLDNKTIMEEIRKLGCYPNEFDVARRFYELGQQSKKRELLPMIERICVSCPEKVKAESGLDKFTSKYCVHCSIEHCPGVKACYTSSNEQLQ